MIPNTFIIGAPKAGTTALARYLADHPNVFFSVPKEPLYWATDLPRSRHEIGPTTSEEYLNLFNRASTRKHTIVAEGSTNYLRSRVAVPQILEFNANSRFIAMVRNPAQIAVAFHAEQVYMGCEPVGDFARAWALQDERERGRDKLISLDDAHQVLYRRIASIGSQIESLFSAVPARQRHVVVLDDMAKDPQAVYRAVLEFLDLGYDGRSQFDRENSAHVQRFPRISRALLHPPRPLVAPARAVREFLLRHPTPSVAYIKSKLRVERARAAIEPSLAAELSRAFEPEVALLEQLLGRSFPEWRYVP